MSYRVYPVAKQYERDDYAVKVNGKKVILDMARVSISF